MGAVEKGWRILLLPVPFDPEQRVLLLIILYHLSSLRIRFSEISQIRIVFQGPQADMM